MCAWMIHCPSGRWRDLGSWTSGALSGISIIGVNGQHQIIQNPSAGIFPPALALWPPLRSEGWEGRGILTLLCLLPSPLRSGSSKSPLLSQLCSGSSKSPLLSQLRSGSSKSPLLSQLRSGSSKSPLLSQLRSGSSKSPLLSQLRSGSSKSPLLSQLRSGSSKSPLLSPLRSGSWKSPPLSPLRSGSSKSPLLSPLRSGSSKSPLHSRSSQSPPLNPLRSGSSQSPLQRPRPGLLLCRPRPGLLLCRPRPGLLLCRPRPGHLLCRPRPGLLLCCNHPGTPIYLHLQALCRYTGLARHPFQLPPELLDSCFGETSGSRSLKGGVLSWVQAWRSSLSPPEVAISLSPGLILPYIHTPVHVLTHTAVAHLDGLFKHHTPATLPACIDCFSSVFGQCLPFVFIKITFDLHLDPELVLSTVLPSVPWH